MLNFLKQWLKRLRSESDHEKDERRKVEDRSFSRALLLRGHEIADKSSEFRLPAENYEGAAWAVAFEIASTVSNDSMERLRELGLLRLQGQIQTSYLMFLLYSIKKRLSAEGTDLDMEELVHLQGWLESLTSDGATAKENLELGNKMVGAVAEAADADDSDDADVAQSLLDGVEAGCLGWVHDPRDEYMDHLRRCFMLFVRTTWLSAVQATADSTADDS